MGTSEADRLLELPCQVARWLGHDAALLHTGLATVVPCHVARRHLPCHVTSWLSHSAALAEHGNSLLPLHHPGA